MEGAEASAAEHRDHFADCAACRRELLDTDATLLFLGASRLEVDASEIAAVRQTVDAMRRTRDLELPERRTPGRAQRAVAAGFLLAALLVLPAGERPSEAPSPVDGQRAAAFFQRRGATLVSDLESPSVLENLDRPTARVYQLTENDLSVVMIVDETLDL